MFNVVVTLAPSGGTRPSRLGDLPLRTPGGSYIRLSHVADVYETTGRYAVGHLGAQRVRVVTTNVEGRDLASFTAAVKRKVAREVKLPPGVYVGFGGAARPRPAPAGTSRSMRGSPGSASCCCSPWSRAPRRTSPSCSSTCPSPSSAGCWRWPRQGAWCPSGRFVGFVTLFGISLRKPHHDDRALRAPRARGGPRLVHGGGDRGRGGPVVPILMTSLVTGLGLLPLALGAGNPAGRSRGRWPS